MKALPIAALLLLTIPALAHAQEVQIFRVVDGDTIKLLYKGVEESVRLIGVDTPERGQPGFNEATKFTARMVTGKTVHLEFDHTLRDRYKRLLAYVFLPDGRMLNEELIRAGHSRAYTKYPFKYMTRFINIDRPILQEKKD
tara:strand:- start:118 stop:540 length:423 start_codon:yes stop_codon:yes gene_type:complete